MPPREIDSDSWRERERERGRERQTDRQTERERERETKMDVNVIDREATARDGLFNLGSHLKLPCHTVGYGPFIESQLASRNEL